MRNWTIAATMAAVVAPTAAVEAAPVTRSFTLAASSFTHFSNKPSPVRTITADFTLTYDDMASGFMGAPVRFTPVTTGSFDVDPFSTPAIFGYFPANAFSMFPRLGVGGAINGGNVLLPGTNDFYFTFYASAGGPTSAMLSYSTASGDAFIATDALVTPSASTSAVPEPAGWALMVAGFGAVGVAIRRRPSRTAIA